jgi:hypothetical protein
MPSPIEEIYLSIYGNLPKKSGTAFERLASIATFVLHGGEVIHDARLRGQFSNTLYQVDIHHVEENSDEVTMGEAKDYSLQAAKVGRGDLQKLVGAISDLAEVNDGAFFSATGYSKPAIKYAQAASSITDGKEIKLYDLVPSTEKDNEGFIKTIKLNIHYEIAQPLRGKFTPIFNSSGRDILQSIALKDGESSRGIQAILADFYDLDGNIINTLSKITSRGYGEATDTDTSSHGCYVLPNHHLKIHEILVGLNGIEYCVPYEYFTREIIITDDSTNRFILKDDAGNPLLVLTDERLRQFSFDEEGNLLQNSLR